MAVAGSNAAVEGVDGTAAVEGGTVAVVDVVGSTVAVEGVVSERNCYMLD